MKSIKTTKFEQFISSIAEASTGNDLYRLACNMFKQRGIMVAGYRHIPPNGAKRQKPEDLISVMGMSPEWIECFCTKRFFTLTKFVRSTMYSSTPLKWSDLPDLPDINVQERRMIAAFSRFNPGQGIFIPVFGPHNRNGIFTVGFGESEYPPSGITISELQFLCQVLHHRLCNIVQKEILSSIKLSMRETEVLSLMTIGLSNPEIAAKLGVTANTVNTYVRRIFEKLNVSNRGAAIVRAAAFGLLQQSDLKFYSVE